MKKLFTIAVLMLAIASFGGIATSAHAETAALSPTETAALQETLNALKAKLSDLQAQATAQSGAPAPLPSATMTTDEIAALRMALTSLASALTGLQIELSANPQLTAGREAAVSLALTGIGRSLALISKTLGGSGATSAPVAIAVPPPQVSVPAPVSGAPAASPTPSVTGALPNVEVQPSPITAAGTPGASAAPETAQIASTWSLKNLNWPLAIMILLVLAVIASWLFWPVEEPAPKGGKDLVKKDTTPMLVSTPGPAVNIPTPATSPPPAPMKTIPHEPPQQRKPA